MLHHSSCIHWLSHIHNDSNMAFLFSEDALSFLVKVTKLPEALLHVITAGSEVRADPFIAQMYNKRYSCATINIV